MGAIKPVVKNTRHIQTKDGIILLKEEGRTGFSEDGRAAPRDFPRRKPKGNPEEQPCQPKEDPEE